MELVQQSRTRLRVPPFAIHPQLPLYLRLMLGVMVVVAYTMVLTRLMQPPPYPFAVYDDSIAGDTHDPAFGSDYETLSHAAFDLACIESLTSRYCLYKPVNGPFAEIRFVNLNDEGDSGIYFAVRDNALTVGDMARLWGRPTIERHENSLVLHWPDQHMSTVVRSDNKHFSYSLPVPYLLLAAYSSKPLDTTPFLP